MASLQILALSAYTRSSFFTWKTRPYYIIL